MLKKLFYNDFHAIRRRVLPLLLACLGCGAGGFCILLLDAVLPSVGDLAAFLDNTLTAVLIALCIVFAVLTLLAFLHIFLHYRQNFFTEEGYLTFMLPATREELLASKLITGYLWLLILLLVDAVTLIFGAIIPIELLMRAENVSFLSTLLRDLADVFTVLGTIDLLTALAAQLILIDTAITVGAILFRKKPLLGTALAYALFFGVTLLLRTLFALLFDAVTSSEEIFTALASILISVAAGVVGYLLSRTLLTRKLNLV